MVNRNTLFRDRWGFLRFWVIVAIAIAIFATFILIFVVASASDPRNDSNCDIKVRECSRDQHWEQCDGDNLIIKYHVRGGYSTSVSPNSPKCKG